MPEQAWSNKVNNTTPLALSPTLPRGERDGASNAGIKGMRQPLWVMFVTLGRRVASRPRKGTLNRVLRSRSLARQSYGRQHCRNSHGTAERTLAWGVFVTQSRAGHLHPISLPPSPTSYLIVEGFPENLLLARGHLAGVFPHAFEEQEPIPLRIQRKPHADLLDEQAARTRQRQYRYAGEHHQRDTTRSMTSVQQMR